MNQTQRDNIADLNVVNASLLLTPKQDEQKKLGQGEVAMKKSPSMRKRIAQ